MTPGARRSKGRRLQVEVAELFSSEFSLSIEAESPTRPGQRSNGAMYLPEGQGDLRIRRSGQPGVDVALLSERSREMILHPDLKRTAYIECKNTESWHLDGAFWSGRIDGSVLKAFAQSVSGARVSNSRTLLVFSKNRHPTLVVFLMGMSEPLDLRIWMSFGPVAAVKHKNKMIVLAPLSSYVSFLKHNMSSI